MSTTSITKTTHSSGMYPTVRRHRRNWVSTEQAWAMGMGAVNHKTVTQRSSCREQALLN